MKMKMKWKKAGQIQHAGYSRGIILLVILSPSENKNLFVEKKKQCLPKEKIKEWKGKIRTKTTICSLLVITSWPLNNYDRWVIMRTDTYISLSSVSQRTAVGLSDLHSAAVHLDNLRSESLYGGQDLFLVIQRGDAET